MSSEIFLSIIIPAYNESGRLPDTLQKIRRYLNAQDFNWEVLIIENGSTDNTFAIAHSFCEETTGFQAYHLEESGKGRAVRFGMLEARGKFRFMCDADLSMPITELEKFLPPRIDTPKIVIGSREAPGAVRYNEPSVRHFGGRAVNLMIRLLAVPGIHDTQCGFKLFSADVTEDLFNHLSVFSWGFDIELLYVAKLRGYPIIELPIDWYYGHYSHVSPIKDTLEILKDILLIRWNHFRGRYE